MTTAIDIVFGTADSGTLRQYELAKASGSKDEYRIRCAVEGIRHDDLVYDVAELVRMWTREHE